MSLAQLSLCRRAVQAPSCAAWKLLMRAGLCSMVGALWSHEGFPGRSAPAVGCSCSQLMELGNLPVHWTLTSAEARGSFPKWNQQESGLEVWNVKIQLPSCFKPEKSSRVGLFWADTTCVEKQGLELQLHTEGSVIHWDLCPAEPGLEPASPTAGFFPPHPHVVFVCQPFIITLKMICCEFVFLMNMNTMLQQLQLDFWKLFL